MVKKITECRAARQGKLESRVDALLEANAAAISAETPAGSNDNLWFEGFCWELRGCAEGYQAMLQDVH